MAVFFVFEEGTPALDLAFLAPWLPALAKQTPPVPTFFLSSCEELNADLSEQLRATLSLEQYPCVKQYDNITGVGAALSFFPIHFGAGPVILLFRAFISS
eukprot:m.250467 g.250467  ORF g.250467 m.250467 type:complete len:100 (+) comp16727_c0_seq1:1339-1638(+)